MNFYFHDRNEIVKSSLLYLITIYKNKNFVRLTLSLMFYFIVDKNVYFQYNKINVLLSYLRFRYYFSCHVSMFQ